LSEVFAAEPDPANRETSTLVGLEKFSISTRSDYALDLSGALGQAERASAPGKIPVVVQFRRSPSQAGDQAVILTLREFVKIARIVEGLEDRDE
jgi:hypothetical protein